MRPLLALLIACSLPLAPLAARASDFSRPSDEVVLVAAQAGMEDMVVRRLTNGAYVDSADHRGRTALMLAVRENHVETVKLLMAHGADLERVDFDGYTACMWAARKAHVSMLHVLLERLKGTPAFDRQARLALGVVQKVGDRFTERALRDLYPDALGSMPELLPPAPSTSLDELPYGTSGWTEYRTREPARRPPPAAPVVQPGAVPAYGRPAAGAPIATPPPFQPIAAPPMVQPAGWPLNVAPAPKDGPLSNMAPIPLPPPAIALPTPAPSTNP